MGFIDVIKERAKAANKTIVLPETEDRRTYEAAAQILKEGIAKIILVGSEEAVKKGSEGLDLTGAVVVDRLLPTEHRLTSTSWLSCVRKKA